MARHRKHEADRDEDPALDISSLIDVCFLLLIYFLVTSTITPRETDLGMALPSPMPTKDRSPIDPMLIQVDSAGRIFTGTGASQQAMDTDMGVRDLPLLRSALEIYATAARAANQKPLVQIFADGEATQQRVIDVLNALAGENITSVTFTDLVD